MKTLKVYFDIEDFVESQDEPSSAISERVHRLGNTFEIALRAQVQSQDLEDFAEYIITIEDERAEAVREILEWITTANVQIED